MIMMMVVVVVRMMRILIVVCVWLLVGGFACLIMIVCSVCVCDVSARLRERVRMHVHMNHQVMTVMLAQTRSAPRPARLGELSTGVWQRGKPSRAGCSTIVQRDLCGLATSINPSRRVPGTLLARFVLTLLDLLSH